MAHIKKGYKIDTNSDELIAKILHGNIRIRKAWQFNFTSMRSFYIRKIALTSELLREIYIPFK